MRPIIIALVISLTAIGAAAVDTVLGPLSGLTWDGSGNNRVAKWGVGTVTYTNPLYCLTLDGVNDYAFQADSADWAFGSGNFTMLTWVRFRGTAAGQGGFWQQRVDDSNWTMFYHRANNLYLISRTNNYSYIYYTAPFVPLSNTWYQIGVMRTNLTKFVFVTNGVQIAGTLQGGPGNGSIPDLAAPVILGSDDYNSVPLAGELDEFWVFSRALSTAELQASYAAGTGLYGTVSSQPCNSNLVSGLHFDAGTGTTATDFSGNGHTATLTNGATWATGKVLGPNP